MIHKSIALEEQERAFTAFGVMLLQPVISLKEEKKSLIILKSRGEMWTIHMI